MVLLAMMLILGHFQNITAEKCSTNEKKVDCAREISCQATCDEPKGKLCPRMCSLVACECLDGYVRDDNLNCIPIAQCHARKVRDEPEECGANEIQSECAPHPSCQPSCNRLRPRPCPRMCGVNRCVCKENYVRVSRSNQTCVEASECEQTETNTKCGENEEYTKCASQCQASCGNTEENPCLVAECIPGCVCKKGYSRATNNITSACIDCDQ
ncbi:hypothetical protein I4U23_001342 [Adineta vaga]|nr:hypothetical protein I4U23_001342 [Adineta vaga]